MCWYDVCMRIDRRASNIKHADQDANYGVYLKNRKRLFSSSDNLVYHLCGKRIDKTLKYPDRMAFTADHAIPTARGDAVSDELLPAHSACNTSRG